VPAPAGDPTLVGIVHGRDRQVRDATFNFVRALGLKPLEWDTLVAATGSSSPFIGHVVEQLFTTAQAVIVLFTPDDLASLHADLQDLRDPQHEREPTGQPRPNVLFEAGMAFGSHPDRTILVEVGELRPVSDLAGRHAIRLDGAPENLNRLAQRLASAGCPVDMSGTDWLDPRPWAVLGAYSRVASSTPTVTTEPAMIASAAGTVLHRTLGGEDPPLLIRVGSTLPMRPSEHASAIIDDAIRRDVLAAVRSTDRNEWRPFPPNTTSLATYLSDDGAWAFTVDIGASQVAGGGMKVICDRRCNPVPGEPSNLVDLQRELDGLVAMNGRLAAAAGGALGLKTTSPLRVAAYLKSEESLDSVLDLHPTHGEIHAYPSSRHDALFDEASWPTTSADAEQLVDRWLFLFVLQSGLIGQNEQIRQVLQRVERRS
jgi:hypothetical protein